MRCFRARELFYKATAQSLIKNYSQKFTSSGCQFSSRNFIITRQLHTNKRSNPWNTPRIFTQVNAFLSDFPSKNPQNHDAVTNGYAVFSTSAAGDDDAKGKKPPAVVKHEQRTSVADAAQQVPDTKIIATLAKYLWMKDNFEFRLRVIAALGFLVGAKVRKITRPHNFLSVYAD